MFCCCCCSTKAEISKINLWLVSVVRMRITASNACNWHTQIQAKTEQETYTSTHLKQKHQFATFNGIIIDSISSETFICHTSNLCQNRGRNTNDNHSSSSASHVFHFLRLFDNSTEWAEDHNQLCS